MTPCGCRIEHTLYEGIIPEGWQVDMVICRIVYCPIHAQAEAMYNALLDLLRCIGNAEYEPSAISHAKDILTRTEPPHV